MKLILAFVMLLVGVLLIGTTAVEILDKTEKKFAYNETIDIAPARKPNTAINQSVIFTLDNAGGGCPIENYVFKNQSGGTLVDGEEYSLNVNTGKFFYSDSIPCNLCSNSSNTTFVDYGYCSAGYLPSLWQRTVLNSIVGFLGLALMLIAVGLFYSILKDEGFA